MKELQYEVLVDRSERPGKCTILPLEGRADFHIRRFARGRPIAPLKSDLLLHIDGQPLNEIRERLQEVTQIGVIDSQWRRVPSIAQMIEAPLPFLALIPPGFQTAYPRRNKEGKDPTDGLATIEAIFIAAAFCGVWDESLLAKYHFAAQFLDINRDVFTHYELKSHKLLP